MGFTQIFYYCFFEMRIVVGDTKKERKILTSLIVLGFGRFLMIRVSSFQWWVFVLLGLGHGA